MTTHPSAPAGTSQCEKILAELQRRTGQWVSLMDLHAVSGSMAVHSRIADLRIKRGLIIDHRNQRKGRMVHSSYRLDSSTQLSLF